MICQSCGERDARDGHDECFACHVSGVSFGFRGGVRHGRNSWNASVSEWKSEHLGATDDKELAKRGIERAS